MKRFQITPEIFEKAKARDQQQGVLFGSTSKGSAQIYGCIAEELFQTIYPEAVRVINPPDCYDCDFYFNNYKIEIKARMFYVLSRLQPHFLMTEVREQKCDVYVFFGIHRDLDHGYLLGTLTKDEYLKHRKFQRKGELIPGYKARAADDGYLIELRHFKPTRR